jgi:hypothetical protein
LPQKLVPTYFVAGTSLFGQPNMKEAIGVLREVAQKNFYEK